MFTRRNIPDISWNGNINNGCFWWQIGLKYTKLSPRGFQKLVNGCQPVSMFHIQIHEACIIPYLQNKFTLWCIVWKLTTICTLNTLLRTRQNGHHFADDIFKCIFLNDNVGISIKIALRFVPKSPIYNIPSLVQIIAGRLPGEQAIIWTN